MATIKERAINLTTENGRFPLNEYDLGFVDMLETMALEQRQIDIDKACEWLKNNKKSDYINDEPCQFGGRAELDDLFIEEFRKAMEE